MIKKIAAFLFRLVFKVRYKVIIKGLEHINKEALPREGGILFLPSHPTIFIDPTLVTLAILQKFPVRPMIVEYMYYLPIVNWVMRYLQALPIPSFTTSSNSLKRKKSEESFKTVIRKLAEGDNFLIYPAGKTKQSASEVLGGASGVHRILQEAPTANVVLIRTKGLWGSMFSRALEGTVPALFPTLIRGIKITLKNLLFFTPRREVIIEFEPAGEDFPFGKDRRELNQYLERWYNRPDGLTHQEGAYPGDSLILVPHSIWKADLPSVKAKPLDRDRSIDLTGVPPEIVQKVKAKLAEMKECEIETIAPEMDLAGDLGLDSLDAAELITFLQDQFDVEDVPLNELTTVAKLIALASGKIQITREISSEEEADVQKWKRVSKRTQVAVAKGNTIPEVFLNNCRRMGHAVACGDARSKIVTYPTLKLRVILLAEVIRRMKGDHIGILLPASVAANLLTLATLLAGKIPVMVNWTIGPRHLQAVLDLSGVQSILTSWSFIDRLGSVNLTPIEDRLIMVEDLRRNLSLKDKLKAYILSKRRKKVILRHFGADRIKKESTAALLFTSGTENLPKGVPLSHENILSNLRASFDSFPIFTDDVFFGFLPPFHAFGFTLAGLAGLLTGLKVAYSPNPTDGKGLARAVERWGVTVLCGAPIFIKNMLKSATEEQLKSLRIAVTGAEKAPLELFDLMKEKGKEGRLVEGYGITECSPVLTINAIGGKEQVVGKALPGVEIRIVHPETYKPALTGEQGLIIVRGKNVFSGYLNKDVPSPFVFLEGKSWYKTGDLGFLDEEANLAITGRLTRFIKVGGEMVSLTAIESVLLDKAAKVPLPKYEGPIFAVAAKEQPGEKTKLVLFTRHDLTVDEVNKDLRQAGFSNLIKISQVTKLNEIPILGTGKVNYRQLVADYLQ